MREDPDLWTLPPYVRRLHWVERNTLKKFEVARPLEKSAHPCSTQSAVKHGLPYLLVFVHLLYVGVGEELVNSSSSVQSTNEVSNKRPKGRKEILRTIKLILLSFVVIFCVVSLSFLKVYDNKWNTITISRKKPFYINVTGDIIFDKETINLRAKGPFLSGEYYNVAQDFVSFKVAKVLRNGTYVPVSKEWKLLLTSNTRDFEIDTKVLEHDFSLEPDEMSDSKTYEVTISTNKKRDYVSMCIDVSVRPKLAIGHIVMALFVLIGLYILIIFERNQSMCWTKPSNWDAHLSSLGAGGNDGAGHTDLVEFTVPYYRRIVCMTVMKSTATSRTIAHTLLRIIRCPLVPFDTVCSRVESPQGVHWFVYP
ncbi:p protein [Trichonephila clavipes]|uniref:P protein n=1 Tax=Trichonephila clavipes TaxID=2585209 RepID=A0A8X6RH11_TRICX|nr:p protein [Trichonephila clavipes]